MSSPKHVDWDTVGAPCQEADGIGRPNVNVGLGKVIFLANVSSSFACFTVETNSAKNRLVDCIARTADGMGKETLAAVVADLQRCHKDGSIINVFWWRSPERCVCKRGCPHFTLHICDVTFADSAHSMLPLRYHSRTTQAGAGAGAEAVGVDDGDNLNACGAHQSQVTEHRPEEDIKVDTPLATTCTDIAGRRRRKHVKKDDRASHFVNFLVDKFSDSIPLKYPKNGVGILDIAGGSGAVTYELSLRRRIPSIVIDPRPVKLSASQRRTIAFRETTRSKLVQDGASVSHLARVLIERYSKWVPRQINTLFGDEFLQPGTETAELFDSCTAVVGMHPDAATHPIVDAALAANKPWAVVPCCVFPQMFQDRCLKDGSPVRSYDDLCEYLRTINEDVCEAVLDFEGRNRVFYWLPRTLA